MTWLDLEGKPPSVDADGKLTKPFILRLLDADGALRAHELWTVGLKLPDPPAAFAKWVTEIQAARDRRLGVKAREEDSSEATAFKVTRTGKRKRKADAELTAAQLKRRRYNQQRNAEKKRRKS